MRAAPPLCLLALLAGCNFPDPDLRPAPPRRAAFGEAVPARFEHDTPGERASFGGEWVVWEDAGGGTVIHSSASGHLSNFPGWPRSIENAREPALSANGQTLAFVAAESSGEECAAYVVPIGRSESRLLASLPGHVAKSPCLSPDGDHVVYEEAGPEGPRLWTLSTADSRATFVGNGGSPEWSPDGQWIVFEFDHSIWKVHPDGSESTRLTNGRDARNPTWSRSSQWIAFGQFDAEGHADDIWAVRADGSRFLRVTWDPAPEWDPSWAPDGRILFTTIRNGSQGIWVVAPENTELLK